MKLLTWYHQPSQSSHQLHYTMHQNKCNHEEQERPIHSGILEEKLRDASHKKLKKTGKFTFTDEQWKILKVCGITQDIVNNTLALWSHAQC